MLYHIISYTYNISKAVTVCDSDRDRFQNVHLESWVMTAADPDKFAQWGPVGQGFLRNCVSWWPWGEWSVGCFFVPVGGEMECKKGSCHHPSVRWDIQTAPDQDGRSKMTSFWRRMGHCQLPGFIFGQRSLPQKSLFNGKQAFANSLYHARKLVDDFINGPPARTSLGYILGAREVNISLQDIAKFHLSARSSKRSGLAKRGKLWCWLKSCRTRFLARRQFDAFRLAGMGMGMGVTGKCRRASRISSWRACLSIASASWRDVPGCENYERRTQILEQPVSELWVWLNCHQPFLTPW